MRAELLGHLCRALMRLTPDLLILDRHLRVYSPWAPSYCSLSTFPLPFIFFPLISFPFMHPLLLPACPHAIFSPFLQCWPPPNSKQMCTCVHMHMCVKEKDCSFYQIQRKISHSNADFLFDYSWDLNYKKRHFCTKGIEKRPKKCGRGNDSTINTEDIFNICVKSGL